VKINFINLFMEKPKQTFYLPEKLGYSCVWDEVLRGFYIQIPNGHLFYAEHFFSEKISDRSLDYFLENRENHWKKIDWKNIREEQLDHFPFKNIQWSHQRIQMYGKQIYSPRFSAWYGDEGKKYAYSGLKLTPLPWNKGLNYIKSQIEPLAGVRFNSVLLNWYRDGDDYMGWHADDEKELGLNPVIASVNFGAQRRFLLRRKDDLQEVIEIALKHGSLLIMGGEIQHHWKHQVPKEKKIKEHRLNLTFRVIV
jgi:alkylated DNA repair dioxygenase AlkB